jgi:hypothetical protein
LISILATFSDWLLRRQASMLASGSMDISPSWPLMRAANTVHRHQATIAAIPGPVAWLAVAQRQWLRIAQRRFFTLSAAALVVAPASLSFMVAAQAS